MGALAQEPGWEPAGSTSGGQSPPPITITSVTADTSSDGSSTGSSTSGEEGSASGDTDGSSSEGSSSGGWSLPEHRPGLGIGLADVADWSSEQPFLDLVKSSRWWSPSGSAEPLDLDASGWLRSVAPGEDPHLVLMTLPEVAARNALPFTEYVVRYEGTGELAYAFGASVVSVQPGRDVIDVSGGQVAIRFLSVDVTDPVRNITVVPTALERTFDQGAIFNPVWLDRLRGMRVVRFMDWMDTNDSVASRWSDRPQVDDVSWASGVPVETMVQLANELQADPWFNVPHLATDPWVSAFAGIVADGLDGHLRPYVEHSNEIWNYQFGQAHFAESQGLAAGLHASPFEALLLYHLQRSLEIWDIWEDAAGAEGFVRVLGSQAGNPWVTERLLAEARGRRVDALAIAPYFGNELGAPTREAEISMLTADEVMDLVENTSVPAAIGTMAAHGGLTQQHGVELVAYEGGQHLAGFAGVQNNPVVSSLFVDANRSPRMYDAYLAAMEGWRAAGGRLFVAFVDVGLPGPSGSWGALEFATQASSPKWDALQTERDRACWWSDCNAWR